MKSASCVSTNLLDDAHSDFIRGKSKNDRPQKFGTWFRNPIRSTALEHRNTCTLQTFDENQDPARKRAATD